MAAGWRFFDVSFPAGKKQGSALSGDFSARRNLPHQRSSCADKSSVAPSLNPPNTIITKEFLQISKHSREERQEY